MANLELYQTLFGISDPRWSCSTVKFRGSAALELFLQSWSSPKHALTHLSLTNEQNIFSDGNGKLHIHKADCLIGVIRKTETM
jgi:hypothetical protein